MANNNYIPQVDYTSRDYEAIRQDLVNLIPTFAPNWTNRDPADFGMTLIELFSYMGDMLSYYIDRSANESFITTATQRSSVINIASLLGYEPSNGTPATVTLNFKNASEDDIVVPALTQVATTNIVNGTSTQIIFETDSEITVDALNTTTGVDVTATQGITSTEVVGVSDGTVNQSYALTNPYVVVDSIQVLVDSNAYQIVNHLIDYSGYDPVASTYTTADFITYIIFGDNVGGRVPPLGKTITVTYRTSSGVTGNVAQNNLNYIIYMPSGPVEPGLGVSNQAAATGGSDPESTDSIRVNSSLSVRAINRAVSLTDYGSIAVNLNGISKAIALGASYNSVTLYFVPQGDSGVENDMVTPSSVFNTYAGKLATYFEDKSPPTTTITYQPATYVPVNLVIKVTLLTTYKQSLVQTAISSAIADLFDTTRVSFGQRIGLQDVITAIAVVPGVAYTQVVRLLRDDQDISKALTAAAVTSNVATVTVGSAHGFQVGDTVLVDSTAATFNGTFVVTATASTTIDYSLITTDVSLTPTGTVSLVKAVDVICEPNEIPTLNLNAYSVTVSGGIN